MAILEIFGISSSPADTVAGALEVVVVPYIAAVRHRSNGGAGGAGARRAVWRHVERRGHCAAVERAAPPLDALAPKVRWGVEHDTLGASDSCGRVRSEHWLC